MCIRNPGMKNTASPGLVAAAAAALLLILAPSLAAATPPTQDLNAKSDCGAAGDGSTDDTTSIQSCIATATTGGQGIYFPPGTYKITAALTISSGNMLLHGINSGTTKIVQFTAADNLFTIANGGNPVNQVSLRNLQLEYNAANPAGITMLAKQTNPILSSVNCGDLPQPAATMPPNLPKIITFPPRS